MTNCPQQQRQANELAQSIRAKRIPHHHWKEAEKDAFAMLVAAQPGELVCITGPSRSGKTRLCQRLRSLLVPSVDPEAQGTVDGTMPTAMLQAANSGANGAFSTKGFTLHALDVLEHPFYSEGAIRSLSDRARSGLSRTPERELATALSEALKYRKVQYLFVDELQHVRYAPGGERGAAAILDNLKCLAERTGIILIFVGAYPILQVLEKSPHMQGRKHQVHLQRYRANAADLLHFKAILEAYSKVLPLRPGESLCDYIEMLYNGSLGCIGILEMWLRASVAYINEDTEPELTPERLQKRRRPARELDSIAREILEGEDYLAEIEGRDKVTGQSDQSESKSPNRTSKGKRKTKPFKNSPKVYSRDARG